MADVWFIAVAFVFILSLLRELGLLRQRSHVATTQYCFLSDQIFSYLIVIDFESTCWRERNNYSQEIIEFPAVLLNTSTGKIESEFHTYVQPQEHPVLSKFCTELTGITQVLESGIPLQICLSRFSRWLQKLQLEMGLVLPSRQQRCSAPSPSQKLCTFLTWSDWDLGVCLQYECKRKQLHKPDVLNSWIDLRSTYRLFYNRKPKGLNGALQDLGLQFSGREHSGLDDSRNTAELAAKMMRDGCVMKITRSLEGTPSTFKPMFGNTTAGDKKEKPNTNKGKTLTTNKPSSSKIPLQSCQINSCLQSNTSNLNTKENPNSIQESVQTCQSLVSPKTLLNGTATILWGYNSSRSVNTKAVTSASPHNKENNCLVLCSTTVGCLSNLPQPHQPSNTGTNVGPMEEEESTELLVETEERCGSYDDMLLDSDDVINQTDREWDVEHIGYDSGCYVWEEPENSHSLGAFTLGDSMKKTSTPNTSLARSKAAITQHTKCKQTPKSSFTIYSGPAKRAAAPSCPSLYTPKNVLASLSTNIHPSSSSRSSIPVKPKEGGKITSPLCACGRRAKRQVVSNGGPNHGRGFYCCPVRRSGSGGRMQKGCEFFKWESSLKKTSSVASVAITSSVSLCHINSTLSCRPHQRSPLSKSY
uniref:ERI1 exoribonuclease 2 n=1 Tax=Monopterus albus TaxID=43700 RepID=A0A3Q3K5A3_MONAL